MKRQKLIFLTTAITFGSVLSLRAVDLSLQSSFERAKDANFTYLINQQNIEIAQTSVTSARSGFLPTINAEASQSRSMVPNVSGLTTSIPGIPSRSFVNRFDAVIRAQLSLLSFSSIDDFNLSRLSLTATRQQLDETVQSILESIGVAYYNHWRNLRRLDVIDANLERDGVLLEIATNQQEAGVATPLDVTRAEVRLAINQLARLQQETTVLNSAMAIKRLLNIPLSEPVSLEGVYIPDTLTTPEFSAYLLKAALQTRPDYQALETQLKRAEYSVSASKRQRLPELFVGGEYGYAAETIGDDMEEQWGVQVGVSVPIFEGFRISAETRQAKAAARQRELELNDLEAEVEANLRLALQELESRYNQITVARKQVNLNQREFELARIRFEEGVADNRDVVDSQAALADGEDTLVEAEYRFLLSRISLARALGDVRRILNDQIIP